MRRGLPQFLVKLLVLCLTTCLPALTLGQTNPLATLIKKERLVEIAPPAAAWNEAVTNQTMRLRDRLRTRELSRAALLLSDLDVLQIDELTTIEVLPADAATGKARLNLRQGAFYFFHRNQPREIEIETPFAVAGVLGTEFHVAVDAAGQTTFSVFDGQLSVSNAFGQIVITNREEALVQPGQPPVRRAMIAAQNILQWCLYYPAVVEVKDFGLAADEALTLAPVLEAYRRGNLLLALDRFTALAPADSPGVRLLRAALLLAVGQVDDCQQQLDSVPNDSPAVRALRTLIAAVKQQDPGTVATPMTASEALAQSYYFQSLASEASLNRAREAAQRATELGSQFGFAWVRLAELEFSFGRVPASRVALEHGLALAEEHAQGYALQGYVTSADNRVRDALPMFERALALDPALANAWLGRGLCRLRLGQRDAGRADLEIAAALEPTRSALRSYLGKAFTEIRRPGLAARELDLARSLDANDPTPWLYSALLSRQQNRINDAVGELERSLELNETRRLYRSGLLLDQDRAVRNASLANIYQGAGLEAASVRKASQAVNSDYGNPLAHLFLAESFNSLRDPKRINLRYESAWFNERLLANLLAPVGGGNLSQHISEQEYSRFFTRDGPGLSVASEYSSAGEARVLASQFGTWRNSAWALDAEYHDSDGYAPNSGFERVEWYAQFKQQLSPADALFVLVKYQDFTAGDTLQYYDPAEARPNLRYSEQQQPFLLAGYQHQWQPGVQTLVLAGRLDDEITYDNPGQGGLILGRDADYAVLATLRPRPFYDLAYRIHAENYLAELNQIFEADHHLIVAGGRVNFGQFDTRNDLLNMAAYQPGLAALFQPPPPGDVTTDAERVGAYAYYTWKGSQLLATAGVAYDHLRYPENFRYSPISDGQTSAEQVSPKAALVWAPLPNLRLRAAWTRSLGGIIYDESVRLEPTQLAGFIQSYRTLISETLVGSVSAPRFETWGAGLEWRPWTNTYTGAQFDWLQQEVDRQFGAFNDQPSTVTPGGYEFVTGNTPEQLRYEEPSVTAYVNQLLGDHWSTGASYRFTRSDLQTRLTEVPASDPAAGLLAGADYHELLLNLRWNHASGWFWRIEGLWRLQDYASSLPTATQEEFWQCNAFVGYRLPRLHGDVTLGVLNLSDQDYRLQPLSPHLDLPRERAFYVSARFRL